MYTNSSHTCPTCGTFLDQQADSLAEGLCPRCLLESSLHSTIAGQPAASPPPPIEEVSAAFTDLEIIELIGRGGMGSVFKARQKSLDRLVALKLLPQSLAADPEFAKRFEAEAKALGNLNHPNIVTVHEFGQRGAFYFLLMEYVDGPNLRNLLVDHHLSPQEALAIVPPLCDALDFAHQRHIVHCDIKPENLILNTNGKIKIADFGIARILGKTSTGAEPEKSAGTPAYMAPEQKDSPHAIDARTDIYSLGVVIYEMLTGERPGANLSPPSKRNSALDVRLDKIVLRALEANPKLRWQSANELNSELQTILTDALGEPKVTPPKNLPTSTRRRAWISCAMALAAVLMMAWSYVAFTKNNSIVQIPEAEHRDAVERYYDHSIQQVDLRHQYDALWEKSQKSQLSPAEEETKNALWDQYTKPFKDYGAFYGVEKPELRGGFVAMLLCIVLGVISFLIGRRHLSWLRGQDEPLPALKAGLVGTLLVSLVFAGGFVLTSLPYYKSPVPNALAMTGILLFVLWTGRRVLAWTRNLRRASAFGIVQFIATALVGLAIAIPLTSAQVAYTSAEREHLSEKIDLNYSHQAFINSLSPDDLLQPEKLEEARRRCEEYAQKQRSYELLYGFNLIELKLPNGNQLTISVIGSLLAFAAALVLLRKFNSRRA